jgi:hypothetical protein
MSEYRELETIFEDMCDMGSKVMENQSSRYQYTGGSYRSRRSSGWTTVQGRDGVQDRD